jgi:hypothetical protein
MSAFEDGIRAMVRQEMIEVLKGATFTVPVGPVDNPDMGARILNGQGPEKVGALLASGHAPKRRAKRAAPAGAGPAPEFTVGQAVRYRQGRGQFAAKVLSISADGWLEVERVADGKRVSRPPQKLVAA